MKKFSRNFQKPLDKSDKVWYNIITVRERKPYRVNEVKDRLKNQKGIIIMAITISIEEFNIETIDRQRCLREDDIKSITEIARDMRGKGEDEILELARQICSQSERNDRARHNETNVKSVKEYIADNCHAGDVLTLQSASRIWNEVRRDHEGAGHYAVLAALDDLVKDGTLDRQRVRRTRYGGTSHIDIYVVK